MSRAGSPLRLARRLVQLLVGLAIMGVAITLLKRSSLGLTPWDVLHDGIARHTTVDLGVIGILVGIPILLLWLPLHEHPGIGTVANAFGVGWVIHVLLPHISPAHDTATKFAMLVGGILIFALGQGLYLGVQLGAGPRDGLMTGLHRRFGWSIRAARTVIEAMALLAGFALGGTVGVGTVVFAFAMGPMVQVTLRWFGFPTARLPELGDVPADAIGLAGE